MKKHKWKRAAFYIRREIIRWAVMLGGTLAVLSIMVYVLEDPDIRMAIYGVSAFVTALAIGSVFYEKEKQHGKNR